MLVRGGLYDALLTLALLVAAWRLVSTDAGVSEIVRPRISMALVVGGAIGLLSGVIGIGGGIFLLPVMMLGGWATAKEAAATTSLFVWLNSMAGLIGAALGGRLDLNHSLLVPFALAVLAGGLVGSRYGSALSTQREVKAILVVVLILASSKRVLEHLV